jgi:hypothetical protein
MLARLPSHLPEHPSAGIGTFADQVFRKSANVYFLDDQILVRLPRLLRAGPSTSLDKSAE